MLLANAEAARALTKEDVDNAYFQVEGFSTQVTTTAESLYESAKSLFDQVWHISPSLCVASSLPPCVFVGMFVWIGEVYGNNLTAGGNLSTDELLD